MSSDQCACGQPRGDELAVCPSCQYAYHETMDIIDEMLRSIDSVQVRAALESLSERLDKHCHESDTFDRCEGCGRGIEYGSIYSLTMDGCYLCEACGEPDDDQEATDAITAV